MEPSSIDIEAAPEKVRAAVLDVDAYPKWVDGVKDSQVTESDAQVRPARASFIVDVEVKTVKYDLTYSYQPKAVSWENVPYEHSWDHYLDQPLQRRKSSWVWASLIMR